MTEANTMTDLQSLISRLEKAEGPDRELDALVFCAVNPNYKPSGPEGCITFDDGNVRWRGWKAAPAVTGSLDAAMTLVLDGFCWGVFDEPFAWVWPNANRDLLEGWRGKGATPALALCIAALKAIEEIRKP